jgi:hypothetical protein
MSRMMYVKYLVVLIYVRGIVIFILYISCICWHVREKFMKFFIFFGVFVIILYDRGVVRKFRDVGEFLWIFLFFRFWEVVSWWVFWFWFLSSWVLWCWLLLWVVLSWLGVGDWLICCKCVLIVCVLVSFVVDGLILFGVVVIWMVMC